MKIKLTGILVLCYLGLASGLASRPAFGLESDRNQPTTIDADQMTYSEKNSVNVFKGNVLLTRGTLVVRGDNLTLTQKADGSQNAVIEGKPATFRQQRDSKNPEILMIRGTGNRIEIDGTKSTVTLIGDAAIRKTSNDQLTEEITGRKITYEQNSEFLTVEGSEKGSGPKGSAPRVQAVIKPKPEPQQ